MDNQLKTNGDLTTVKMLKANGFQMKTVVVKRLIAANVPFAEKPTDHQLIRTVVTCLNLALLTMTVARIKVVQEDKVNTKYIRRRTLLWVNLVNSVFVLGLKSPMITMVRNNFFTVVSGIKRKMPLVLQPVVSHLNVILGNIFV